MTKLSSIPPLLYVNLSPPLISFAINYYAKLKHNIAVQ